MRPQQQRADAEYAAAAAEVQRAHTGRGIALKRGKAQLRRGVAAGTEGNAGVKAERNAPIVRRVHPLRHNDKLFADLYRLIAAAPTVFPVLIGGIAGDCLRKRSLYARKHRLPGLIVRQVTLYAAHALVGPLQLRVNIVPILAVIFKKALKIRLVLYYKAIDAEFGKLFTARIKLPLRRVDTDFNIAHTLLQILKQHRTARQNQLHYAAPPLKSLYILPHMGMNVQHKWGLFAALSAK